VAIKRVNRFYTQDIFLETIEVYMRIPLKDREYGRELIWQGLDFSLKRY